jgi:hypothetical protein
MIEMIPIVATISIKGVMNLMMKEQESRGAGGWFTKVES